MKNESDFHQGLPLDDEGTHGEAIPVQILEAPPLDLEIDPTVLIISGIKKSALPLVDTNPDSWRQTVESRGVNGIMSDREARDRVRGHMARIGYRPNRIF